MEECRILTTQAEVEALASEWNALAAQSDASCFADYDAVHVWMQTLGRLEKTRYHVVTLRHQGRLIGLLPLVVTRKYGLRLLRWAGHDVFFGPLHLYETEAGRETLWRAALASPHYDIAKIKYVFARTPENRLIRALPAPYLTDSNAMLAIDFPPCEEKRWIDTLSKSQRKHDAEKVKKLSKCGPVAFHVWSSGQIPYDRIARMMGYKNDWAKIKNEKSGLFLSQAFTMDLVRMGDRNGTIRVHELRCGDETVALSICFARQTTLYGYIATRHMAWKKYSVGILCTTRIAEWAAQNGFTRLHMMEGETPYKLQYTNKREAFDIYLWGATRRGRWAAALYGLIKRLKPSHRP